MPYGAANQAEYPPLWAVSKEHPLCMLPGSILICQDVVRHHPHTGPCQGMWCQGVTVSCCCQTRSWLNRGSDSRAGLTLPAEVCGPVPSGSCQLKGVRGDSVAVVLHRYCQLWCEWVCFRTAACATHRLMDRQQCRRADLLPGVHCTLSMQPWSPMTGTYSRSTAPAMAEKPAISAAGWK